MVVDNEDRVHVLMQGEDGRPVHFQRDPKTKKWSRQKANGSGKLVVGTGDTLYVVGDDGLKRTFASHFGKMESIASVKSRYFEDSKMGIDLYRDDGWISVIGQRGKIVNVVDYRIEK